MMSTRDDMSNMPTGGITRRSGASTGSVRSRNTTYAEAIGVPGRTGNHDNRTRGEHDEPIDGQQRAENLVHVRARAIQASCLQPLLLLLGDLDVRGRQQEHLVGGLRHRAVQRVREAAREVDQPALQVTVDALQVQDDGLAGLQPVADLLGVVEALGLHHVHPRRRHRDRRDRGGARRRCERRRLLRARGGCGSP